MDELSKIILTSSLAMLGGVVVYLFGRIVEKFVIEPYQEFKKLIGKIEFYLIYHAGIYSNPVAYFGENKKIELNELYTKASFDFRELASNLVSFYNQVSIKNFFIKIPSENELKEASHKLILLSNCIYIGDAQKNSEAADDIRNLLNIKKRL